MANFSVPCTCERPLLVYNKGLGREITVPCGKCLPCRLMRQNVWVRKLDSESKCHKFVYNLYLDYSDDYVPYFDFSFDGNKLVQQRKRCLTGTDKDFIDLDLLGNYIDFKNDKFERDYFLERLNTCSNAVLSGSVRDIQLFKKRLNRYLQRFVTGRYENFRSAIVLEYGPTTFRPHYHGVLYFDDERVASCIAQYVHKAWQDGSGHSLGHTDCNFSKGAISKYITKYISRPTHLPALYSYPSLRPFFLTSRHPPLGSLVEPTSEIRKIVLDSSLRKPVFKVQNGCAVTCLEPIGKGLENRLFPKLPLYSLFSDSQRIKLYRCAFNRNGQKLIDFLYDLLLDSFGFVSANTLPFDSPTSLSSFANFDEFQFQRQKILNRYRLLAPNEFRDCLVKFTDFFSPLCLESRLNRLFTVSKRVYNQAAVLGIYPDVYINCIIKYYEKKESSTLKSFYESQSLLMDSADLDYRVFYPDSCYHDILPCNNELSESYFRDRRFLYDESMKTPKKNAYFESLKLKDKPLYHLVKNYYYGKKCNEIVEALA